jgi:hypothetical protein
MQILQWANKTQSGVLMAENHQYVFITLATNSFFFILVDSIFVTFIISHELKCSY